MTNMIGKWRKLENKRKSIEADLWFLNRCINENLTPKFAVVKPQYNCRSLKGWQNQTQKRILRNAVREKYQRLEKINSEKWDTWEHLTRTLPHEELQTRLNDAQDDIEANMQQKTATLRKKLDNLRQEKHPKKEEPWTKGEKVGNFSFHPRVKFLCDDNIFNKEEKEILELGLKYSFKKSLNFDQICKFSIDVDLAIQRLKVNEHVKTYVRQEASKILNEELIEDQEDRRSRQKVAQQQKLLKGIKKKLEANHLTMTKDDKSECIVILKTEEYEAKMIDFFKEGGFKKASTKRFENAVNAFNHTLGMAEETIKKFTGKDLTVKAPQITKSYLLIKLHKENFPGRGVASYCTSHAANLARFLNDYIKRELKFKPKRTIVNTMEFLEKINGIKIEENDIILSFDVKNLFPSIPKIEIIKLVEILMKKNKIEEKEKEDILNLVKIILKQDFIEFKNEIWEQKGGLSIGSPLSPVLADLYMDMIESEIFKEEIVRNQVKIWLRFVDDVFLIVKNGKPTAEKILKTANNINKAIEFTVEYEDEGKINFLDLTLTKKEGKIEAGIYRKPNKTSHTLSSSSNVCPQHKQAAFNSYAHRLVNTKMTEENFGKEKEVLHFLAERNGYTTQMVDRIIEKTKKKKDQKNRKRGLKNIKEEEEKPKRYLAIPYLGKISQRIACFLRKFDDVTVAFRSQNRLKDLLLNNKPKPPKDKVAGVYQLKCKEENCKEIVYIGSTERQFAKRKSEHLKRPKESAFGFHLKFNGHEIDEEESKVIYKKGPKDNREKLELLESYEVSKQKGNGMKILNKKVNIVNKYTPMFKLLQNNRF